MIYTSSLVILPGLFDPLIRRGEWESFGESISDSVYHQRLATVRQKIGEAGLDGLFVFADCYRMSNARWLVDYRTIDGVYPQPMLLFITSDNQERDGERAPCFEDASLRW